MGKKNKNEANETPKAADLIAEAASTGEKLSQIERFRRTITVWITIAQTEQDPSEAKKQLGNLVTELSLNEEYYKKMLSEIQSAKKRAIKALNEAKINNAHIAVKEG